MPIAHIASIAELSLDYILLSIFEKKKKKINSNHFIPIQNVFQTCLFLSKRPQVTIWLKTRFNNKKFALLYRFELISTADLTLSDSLRE